MIFPNYCNTSNIAKCESSTLKWLLNVNETSLKETHFLKLGFTPCKADQPLQDMELQEKKAQK